LVICLQTIFHVHGSNGSLVLTIKLKTECSQLVVLQSVKICYHNFSTVKQVALV